MLKKLLPVLLVLIILTGCASGNTGTQTAPPNAASPSPSVSVAVPAEASPSPSSAIEASPSPSATAAALSDQLDAIFDNEPTFHGSVLIAQDGKVLLNKGYGMADTEKQIANTPTTIFPIGSNTKQFTAMAIMQLYEKGLLDINDKLSKYLPDFPHGSDITLTNLLTHTSGISDYLNENPEEFSNFALEEMTQESMIKMIENKPLNFEPNAQFKYSNTNYLMLGYIVENVSGLSYSEYMSKNIFEPLGMKNTGIVYADGRETFSTVGYQQKTAINNGVSQFGDISASSDKIYKGAYGAGCLYSTVEDMYLWDQALNTEKLLSKKYMDMIFTNYISEAGPADYGFGWIYKKDVSYGDKWWHGGNIPGFSTEICRYIDKGITVIILTNEDRFNPTRLEFEAMHALSIK